MMKVVDQAQNANGHRRISPLFVLETAVLHKLASIAARVFGLERPRTINEAYRRH